MDLTLRFLGDAALAQSAFKDIGGAATAAGALVKQFVSESIKAYADAERVQRQLKLAAGQYTAALNEQAEAMKAKFAIDDDTIRQMDVLLLRYGAAPGVIGATTEAIANYAAISGNDAASATQALLRAVESGSGSIKSMGIHFKTTGSFAADLASAVEALNKKFGGAAEEDAKSMSGRMRGVGLAVDDLKKTFGAMFDDIDKRFSILDRITRGLNNINHELQQEGLAAFLGLKTSQAQGSAEAEIRRNVLFDEKDPRWQERLARARNADDMGRQLIGQLKASGAIPSEGGQVPPELPTSGIDHTVGKEKKSKEGKDDWGWGPFGDPEKSFKGWEDEYKEYKAKQDADLLEGTLKAASDANEQLQKDEKDEQAAFDRKEKELRALSQMEIDAELEKQKKLDAIQKQANAEHQRMFDHQAQMWREAGDRIGAALVNAIGDQMLRLAQGGDVDPAAMAGDVIATVLAIAGVAVGTYFGAPQVGGAVGGLAGSLVKAGIVAQWGKKTQSHHDGGWIERFHGGGWPGGLGNDEQAAILQTGERVLSRREVSNMGGAAGVERAARGRGATTVNITAMDSQSFLDTFGRDGGRGIFDAVRVGRGSVPLLFHG